MDRANWLRTTPAHFKCKITLVYYCLGICAYVISSQAFKQHVCSSFLESFNFPPTHTIGNFGFFLYFLTVFNLFLIIYWTVGLMHPSNTLNVIVLWFMYIGCIHSINCLVQNNSLSVVVFSKLFHVVQVNIFIRTAWFKVFVYEQCYTNQK